MRISERLILLFVLVSLVARRAAQIVREGR